MKKIFTFVSFFIGTALNAQTPTVDWALQYGITQNSGVSSQGASRSIVTDASGNTYCTGYFKGQTQDLDAGANTVILSSTLSTMGNSTDDIYVLKYNSAGGLVWARQIGSVTNEYALDMAVNTTGDVFVTGYFHGTVDFDPGTPVVNLTSNGSQDVFILKLNSAGTFVWAKNIGGNGNDQGKAIDTDASGNIYLAGNFEQTADLDPGTAQSNFTSVQSADIFILKLNATGDLTWGKQLEGILIDYATGITLDNSGNVIVTGIHSGDIDLDPGSNSNVFTPNGGYDGFCVKLDASGNYMWGKSIGSTSSDNFSAATVDASGNIFVTGYLNGSSAINFDSQSVTPAIGGSAFVAKWSSAGTLSWVKIVSGTSEAIGLTTDAVGCVYTCGYFSGTADFDPGASTYTLASLNMNDVYAFKWDGNGNFMWAVAFGGTQNQSGTSIALYNSKVYLTGDFTSGISFGAFNLACPSPPATIADIYIARLDQGMTPAFVAENKKTSRLSVYPNPATETLYVESDEPSQIIINDVTGKTILEKTGAGKTTLSISHLSPGLYFIQTSNGKKEKFIKQ